MPLAAPVTRTVRPESTCCSNMRAR
jgi:hypothetical protein